MWSEEMMASSLHCANASLLSKSTVSRYDIANSRVLSLHLGYCNNLLQEVKAFAICMEWIWACDHGKHQIDLMLSVIWAEHWVQRLMSVILYGAKTPSSLAQRWLNIAKTGKSWQAQVVWKIRRKSRGGTTNWKDEIRGARGKTTQEDSVKSMEEEERNEEHKEKYERKEEKFRIDLELKLGLTAKLCRLAPWVTLIRLFQADVTSFWTSARDCLLQSPYVDLLGCSIAWLTLSSLFFLLATILSDSISAPFEKKSTVSVLVSNDLFDVTSASFEKVSAVSFSLSNDLFEVTSASFEKVLAASTSHPNLSKLVSGSSTVSTATELSSEFDKSWLVSLVLVSQAVSVAWFEGADFDIVCTLSLSICLCICFGSGLAVANSKASTCLHIRLSSQ